MPATFLRGGCEEQMKIINVARFGGRRMRWEDWGVGPSLSYIGIILCSQGKTGGSDGVRRAEGGRERGRSEGTDEELGGGREKEKKNLG